MDCDFMSRCFLQFVVSLDLGRHLKVMLEENLPFELDTVEYLKEEKELDELMMLEDAEYDKAMERKKREKKQKDKGGINKILLNDALMI